MLFLYYLKEPSVMSRLRPEPVAQPVSSASLTTKIQKKKIKNTKQSSISQTLSLSPIVLSQFKQMNAFSISFFFNFM